MGCKVLILIKAPKNSRVRVGNILCNPNNYVFALYSHTIAFHGSGHCPGLLRHVSKVQACDGLLKTASGRVRV